MSERWTFAVTLKNQLSCMQGSSNIPCSIVNRFVSQGASMFIKKRTWNIYKMWQFSKLNKMFLSLAQLAAVQRNMKRPMTQWLSQIINFCCCLLSRKVQNHLDEGLLHFIIIILCSFPLRQTKRPGESKSICAVKLSFWSLSFHLWFASSSWEEENWSHCGLIQLQLWARAVDVLTFDSLA